MESTIEIVVRNEKNLAALIHGDVESVTVAGTTITKIYRAGYEYHLKVGGLSVYGDELEIVAAGLYIKFKGRIIAILSLKE